MPAGPITSKLSATASITHVWHEFSTLFKLPQDLPLECLNRDQEALTRSVEDEDVPLLALPLDGPAPRSKSIDYGRPTTEVVERPALYGAKLEELEASLPPEIIGEGRTFADLSLYEKKSLLISQELE